MRPHPPHLLCSELFTHTPNTTMHLCLPRPVPRSLSHSLDLYPFIVTALILPATSSHCIQHPQYSPSRIQFHTPLPTFPYTPNKPLPYHSSVTYACRHIPLISRSFLELRKLLRESHDSGSFTRGQMPGVCGGGMVYTSVRVALWKRA